MKRSTLSGYENEVSQPTIPALMAFSKYYGVAIDTLVKVDLRTLAESQFSSSKGAGMYTSGQQPAGACLPQSTAAMRKISNWLSKRPKAGYTTGFADPEYIRDLPVFQLPFLSRQKKYRTFQLNGDSMLPIPDGSYVTGEFVQDWNTIVSGHGYIILTLDEGIVFKIVENLLGSEHKLRLVFAKSYL